MHKLYMHHGVALRGGRANRSAKLPIANQIDLQYKNEMHHGLAVRPCRPGPFLLPSQLGRTVSTPSSQGNTMMHVQLVHGFESWSAQKKNLSNRFKNLVKLELISSDMLYNNQLPTKSTCNIYIHIYIQLVIPRVTVYCYRKSKARKV